MSNHSMPSLAQALQVSLESTSDDKTAHYRCELDPTWSIAAIPQGGYSLGVIVEACIQYQSGSSHVDPIHLSAHFLRATSAAIGKVQVKLLKSGKTFTNLCAELVQQGTTRIMAHLIFGDLTPSHPGRVALLAPPSPYARRLPLHSHPSMGSSVKSPWTWKMEVQAFVDPVLLRQNDPSSPTRTTTKTVGGGGVEWGAWFELTKDDRFTTSCIPFFCDSFVNMPMLLPESELGSGVGKKSWFPTITMTMEFKARIPSSDKYSLRTVGLYSESRFQNDPERRHNARMEVWTAPCEIGRGEITKGWRDHQYCIAIADQMALMLPVEVNMRQGAKVAVKL